ncbi:T9SS type A sorting domain-containing protein [candidate division KSB1 bacterium]|nr:T9SS type A sorting domain-containing protein [candidate division KSB1 bacterium]
MKKLFLGFAILALLFSLSVNTFAQEAGLTLTSMCHNDAVGIMRLINPNPHDITATWKIYGTSNTGTVVALANAHTYFEVPWPGTVVVEYVINNAPTSTTKAQNNNTCTQASKLTLTSMCNNGKGVGIMRLINPNNFDIPVMWQKYPGAWQGPVIALANTNTYFEVPHPGTIKIEYTINYTQKINDVKAQNNNACPKLTLTSMCYKPVDYNDLCLGYQGKMRLRNPSGMDIEVWWDNLNDAIPGWSGPVTAVANTDTYFYTPYLMGTSNTTKIYYYVYGMKYEDVKAQNTTPCCDDPIAVDFMAYQTYGVGPLHVQFKNLSSGWLTEWEWDFGDGTTSTEKNPYHVFQDNPKHVTVTLTGSGPCGSDTETKVNYITINRVVKVDFDGAPIVGMPGLEVQFENKAGGNASHFEWKYGDGVVEHLIHGTVNKVHPKHVYEKAGEYDVALKGWGDGGMDMLTIPGLVYVDSVCKWLPVALVESGATSKSCPWSKAIDNDVYGAAVSVEAVTEDAWAKLIFADSAAHQVQKIRLLVQTIEGFEWQFMEPMPINGDLEVAMITDRQFVRPRYNERQWKYNLMKKFEIWASTDGENFTLVLEGECEGKPGIWEVFELPAAVSANFLKVKIYPRGEDAKYVEMAEIQVLGDGVVALGKSNGNAVEMAVPTNFGLSQNYPNPFNPETTIQFQLPEDADVTLAIYNTQGQLIRSLMNGHLGSGIHNFSWDGTNMSGQQVAGGVYVYKMEATGKTEKVSFTKKMTLMK